MEKVLIFGHKKPDTDSICGSISLAYLKKQLGMDAEARTLGEINNETKFALDYFKVKAPKYLNDVKIELKNTAYMKNYYLNKNSSLYDGFNYMNAYNIGILPIVDDNKKFKGLVALKDIAKYQISDDLNNLYTSYDNLLNTLDGEEVLRFDEEVNVNLLVASYKSTTFIENVNIDDTVGLIVGDRHSIIEFAVTNGAKILIITNSSDIKKEHLEIAKQNHVNIIKTHFDTFTTSRKIWLANYLFTQITAEDAIVFNDEDNIEEIMESSRRYKYSNYPVVNKKGECLGLFRLSDINDVNKKKVILVDHNEKEQSVDGLDEAEIIEVVDHHKIGTIGTSMPINFRNMTVGSSNTIINMMYRESHVDVPKEIAGLMLSGILSDTLLFKSPTTTEFDRKTARYLANIAEVDIEEYGLSMLKAGASLKNKSVEDILFQDFKNFSIDDKKIGVGQITTFDITEIESDKDKFVELLNKIAVNNEYYLISLFVTDVIKNGSYVYFNESAKDTIGLSFGIDDIKQGYYLPDCVSRKKQIIPKIINIIDKK